VPQDVGGPLARSGVRQARHLAHVDHEVVRGDVGGEALVLGHVADQCPDPGPLGGHVVAEDLGSTSGERQEPEEELDERRLARPVGSDQTGDAVADGQVKSLQRSHPRVPLGHLLRLDDRHALNVGRQAGARGARRGSDGGTSGVNPEDAGPAALAMRASTTSTAEADEGLRTRRRCSVTTARLQLPGVELGLTACCSPTGGASAHASMPEGDMTRCGVRRDPASWPPVVRIGPVVNETKGHHHWPAIDPWTTMIDATEPPAPSAPA
jgi:hypothetical protein